jgi:hypothetical protein
MLFSCELRSPMEMRLCHTRHNAEHFWLSGAATRGRRRQKTVEAAARDPKMYWTKPPRWSRRYGYWIAKTLAERQWGKSEDKLRQSVEFRCAGRIECLLGRRGLRVVGAEQRARLSEKGRDSAQHAGIERRVGRRGAALETKSEGSCFPWIQKRDLRICEVAHVA